MYFLLTHLVPDCNQEFFEKKKQGTALQCLKSCYGADFLLLLKTSENLCCKKWSGILPFYEKWIGTLQTNFLKQNLAPSYHQFS